MYLEEAVAYFNALSGYSTEETQKKIVQDLRKYQDNIKSGYREA
jgi:hypothetical protein